MCVCGRSESSWPRVKVGQSVQSTVHLLLLLDKMLMPSCRHASGMLSHGNKARCSGIAESIGKIHLQVGRSFSTCI